MCWPTCCTSTPTPNHQPLTINDQAENDWIRDNFLGIGVQKSNRLWIGFNDALTEGNFVWSSGEITTGYTNWATGEPNNNLNSSPEGEDYTGMWFANGEWNDSTWEAPDFTLRFGNVPGLAEWDSNPTPNPILEPSTMLLLGSGLIGLLGYRWKKAQA